MSVRLGGSAPPFDQMFVKVLLARVILAAAITFLPASPSFSQPAGEKTKSPPSPCEVLKNRFGSQKDWWEAAVQWAEIKPAPIASELSWRWPLQIAQAVHGDSYYLVAHANAQRCYVAVCGGPANACRLFQPPS
jgi:hypothetical protein